MLKLNKLIIIAVTICSVLACNNIQEGESGVSFSVPSMSSDLRAELIKTSVLANSRAILGSTEVQYEIKLGEATVAEDVLSYDDTYQPEFYQELAPGSYSITVDVFNSSVSDTEPVVSGSSDFTVTAGAIEEITVFCTPVSVTDIPVDTSISLNSEDFIPSIVDIDEWEFSMGTEQWYKIESTTDHLTVELDYTNTPRISDFYFVVYRGADDRELFHNSIHSGTSFELLSVANETIYIGVIYAGFCPESMVEQVGTIDLTVSELIVPTEQTVTVSDEWQSLYVVDNTGLSIDVAVTEGQSYSISWDDKEDGTGTYSSGVNVTARKEDGTTYFSYAYDGYSNPLTVTIPTGDSILTLEIVDPWALGTLGVKITEL